MAYEFSPLIAPIKTEIKDISIDDGTPGVISDSSPPRNIKINTTPISCPSANSRPPKYPKKNISNASTKRAPIIAHQKTIFGDGLFVVFKERAVVFSAVVAAGIKLLIMKSNIIPLIKTKNANANPPAIPTNSVISKVQNKDLNFFLSKTQQDMDAWLSGRIKWSDIPQLKEGLGKVAQAVGTLSDFQTQLASSQLQQANNLNYYAEQIAAHSKAIEKLNKVLDKLDRVLSQRKLSEWG